MFFFTSFIYSKTSEDISPPFVPETNNHIGNWEFGGATIVDEFNIMLVPPIQYKRGFLWTNAEIPKGNWDLSLQMQISEGTYGGSFGIWFISQYGDNGMLAGGPLSFHGVGVIAIVEDNIPDKESSKKSLKFYLLQNDINKDDADFTPENLPPSIGCIQVKDYSMFSIKLRFENNKLFLSASPNQDEPLISIGSIPITVDLSQNFIGLTAQNERTVSRIDLFSLKFGLDIDQIQKYRVEKLGSKAPSANFIPSHPDVYRSPHLIETSEQFKRLSTFNFNHRKGNDMILNMPSSNAMEVLSIVDELAKTNFEAAKFSELNEFVRHNIQNYSEKWQKRTVRIVERVQSARNITGAAWDYTTSLVEAFNATMRANVMKTSMEVVDLSMILSEVGKKGFDENGAMKHLVNSVKKEGTPTWIVYAMVAEIVAVALIVSLLSIPRIRNKVLGKFY